jgi:phosphatidate cytidylyltransferase
VTRLLSGLTLIAVFGAAAWWGSAAMLAAIAAAVAAAGAVEFAALAGALGAECPRMPLAVAAAVVTMAVAWPGAQAALPVLMAVVLVFPLLGVARGAVSADSLARASAPVFGALYLGLPLGALAAVRWGWGREAMLLPVVSVILSDTAQYYCGRTFGRRPLSPALSPKKTIEGAVGGLVIGAAAFAAIAAAWWPPTPLPLRLAIGVSIVALGISGDLFESLLKRAAGVKDSSALIPGHGGVLDRIDALLFVAPFYAVVVRHLVPPA